MTQIAHHEELAESEHTFVAGLRKPYEYDEARRLRRAGLPFKRIAASLELSPSTVHLWTRDIELTPQQQEYNLRGPRGPQSPAHIARRTASIRRNARKRRLRWQQSGRDKARERDPLHLAGCMLYWAEGAKARNQVKICNSDAGMLRFFRRFLSTSFDVARDDYRLSLHVYLQNGLSIKEIEEHWLEELGLPGSCLRKHAINPLPTSSSGQKKNKLPFGVATLTVHRTDIVQHIYGAIQEYAGFDEPRWLDGPPRKPRRKGPAGPSPGTGARS